MEKLSLPVQPELTTTWPLPRKRWHEDAKKFVGVYALQWEDNVYVGMTVSNSGFQGRWARHLRALFVRKRADATTKKIRNFIKINELVPQDFQLHVLAAWENPGENLTIELTNMIAVREQEIYDAFAEGGYTMLNNMRPRGTGYERTSGKRKRKKRRTPVKKSN